MGKRKRKQVVQELRQYAESMNKNAVAYVNAILPLLERFIATGDKLLDSEVLSNTELWGYGQAAAQVRIKSCEIGIWQK